MSAGTVAAVDLGATSGRVIVAKVGQNQLDMRTVTRFANTPVQTIDGLHWNVLELYRCALAGLGTALREEPELSSIGIDSWAVDYALMRGERMLGTPFHYRDERTQRGVEAAHALVPPTELYARNGLQFLPFNSLYQLTTDRLDGVLELADGALLIPDLFAFWLTGRRVAERSNASTTGLLSVTSGQWDAELLARLKLPASVFPPLVDAGARIGSLLPAVATELGASRPIGVIAVGSHDTASAVLAVPMRAEIAAYISCGTWGLVGLELERPVLTEAAREANFTNEGGVDGTVRFLHNVMGLWLLSESVRTWEKADGAAGRKAEADKAGLRNIVTMYETMKPKDAARVFDRLNHEVLVPIVLAMNPRKMAEVLAVMQPETAERLTVALANKARGTGDKQANAAPALPPSELQAIDPAAPPR